MANKQGETIRAYQNYDTERESDITGLFCEDVSLAVQSQKDEADINTIVRNFGITGKMPENVRLPSYGDFDGISDYRTAIEAVRAAEAAFMQVPGEVRARFENDPQRYLEFVENPANLEEMRKLGLAKPVVEVPVAVPPPEGA